MDTTPVRVLLAMALLGGYAATGEAAAQQEASAVCLTPGPAAECRTFLIVEVRGQSPFAPAERPSLHQSLAWDLGLAANVAEEWAVGATVGYEFASESTRRRIASLRLRRWLTSSLALELTSGLFRLEDRGYDPADDRTGLNVSFNGLFFDVGMLGLRFDALPWGGEPGAPFEYSLSASGGLQSIPAVAGSAVGAILLLVAIGAAFGVS